MIKDLLEKLKMKGALTVLANLDNVKCKEQFITTLLQTELTYRENQASKRRLKQAKFSVEKEWSDIDKEINGKINFSSLEKLGQDELVLKRNNLCLIGQQGTGKTHSLIALGRKLCRQGVTVKFTTASGLVNELEEAKANKTLSKLMKALTKPQLLIIDELGFIPLSDDGARLLFDVFSRRYESGSIAVSTNLSFEKWVQIFGSVELAAALIDRFTHKCLIYKFEGESVRLREAKKSQEKT